MLQKQVDEAGLHDSFVFEGFVPDIFPYMKGCHLFVLASLFEGMPNVVMEAMAMAKPVVATDVNGARELMQDGKTSLIVPPANAVALANAIVSLIDNPEKLQAFGKAGKERVAKYFTMEQMTDALETYLLSKLESATP